MLLLRPAHTLHVFSATPGNAGLPLLLLQVTRRWLNFEGVAVPCHLAQQLQTMEALVASAAGEDPATAAAAAAKEGDNRIESQQAHSAVNGQANVPTTRGAAAVDQDVTDAAVV
jgi:hypothetical protein